MKVLETPFDGLIIFEPAFYKDERGAFYESWREIEYERYGIKEKFVQDNLSFSHKNVLRGLHYQEDQGQLVSIIKGTIFDVVVDIRSASPTFKQYFSIKLSSEQPRQIYMSPGFAHGFYVLSDDVIMHYKCTQYYDHAKEGGILWSDPEIGIKWPFISTPIIGKRDVTFGTIDNFLKG